jgi:hypothetical protein
MDMRTLLILGLVFIAGCSNGAIPIRGIDVGAPKEANDLQRFEAVAQRMGFARVENRLTSFIGHGGRLENLQTWKWTKSQSVFLSIELVVQEDRYRIVYSDSGTGGWDLIGPACAFYLELMAELKKEFGQDRLTFRSDGCKAGISSGA